MLNTGKQAKVTNQYYSSLYINATFTHTFIYYSIHLNCCLINRRYGWHGFDDVLLLVSYPCDISAWTGKEGTGGLVWYAIGKTNWQWNNGFWEFPLGLHQIFCQIHNLLDRFPSGDLPFWIFRRQGTFVLDFIHLEVLCTIIC